MSAIKNQFKIDSVKLGKEGKKSQDNSLILESAGVPSTATTPRSAFAPEMTIEEENTSAFMMAYSRDDH